MKAFIEVDAPTMAEALSLYLTQKFGKNVDVLYVEHTCVPKSEAAKPTPYRANIEVKETK